MKKFTTALLMLFALASYAQNGPINFEPGGEGADWTWNVFENDANPPLEIIANPDQTGANTSATVAQFTALQAGNPWAGCESQQTVDLGAFEWNEDNTTVKIMVWKSVISDVGIKFDTPTGWSQGEIKVANTVTEQWEELTFDFSSFVNPPASEGMLDRIVIFPDFDLAGRTQDNVVYFDNITFGEGGGGGPVTEPMTAAPTPTRAAADVISLFSDAYTDVPVDTWRTDWSVATLEDIEIEGNPTKKYSALDFVGIETVANQVDVTGMTHIHLDIWSADFTLFGIKLVDFGPDGAFGGGDDTEHQLDFDSPAQGEWISLDLELDDFEGLTGRSNIAQYILVGRPVGSNTVYLDNVYFYNDMGSNTNNPAQLQNRIKVFPNPVKFNEEVRLSEVAAQVEIFDMTGKLIMATENAVTINTAALKQSGVYVVRLRFANGAVQTEQLIVK